MVLYLSVIRRLTLAYGRIALNNDFNATVVRTSFGARIVHNGAIFTISINCYAAIWIAPLYKTIRDNVSAAFRELLVVWITF